MENKKLANPDRDLYHVHHFGGRPVCRYGCCRDLIHPAALASGGMGTHDGGACHWPSGRSEPLCGPGAGTVLWPVRLDWLDRTDNPQGLRLPSKDDR